MQAEQIFLQALVNGVMSALILTLVAVGLCLIFGVLHIVNFAHGEFYMLGGFGAWLFFAENFLPLPGPPTLHYLAALLLTALLVALLGVLVERTLFRPFLGDAEGTIIVSLGLALILQAGALVLFGIRDKPFASPFTGKISFLSISLSAERAAVVICGIIFIIAMHFFMQRTKKGKAMRAVAQDLEAASVLGININLTYSLAMGIACAMAATGGALVGPIFYVNPYMGAEPIMKAFVAVVLGGMGSLPGTVIASFIIAMVESFVTTYLSAHLAMLVVFLIMIAILLLKPTGLLGRRE